MIGAALFVASFLINLAIVSIILVKLPADHFSKSNRKKFAEDRHPVLRVLAVIGKNIAGVLLVVLGIVLSLPGPTGTEVVESSKHCERDQWLARPLRQTSARAQRIKLTRNFAIL